MSDEIINDIAHASAAYCVNCVLPKLDNLSSSQKFELLKACFEANLVAFVDGTHRWIPPEPSTN